MAFYSSAYNYTLNNLPLVDEFLKPAEMWHSEKWVHAVFLLLRFIFIKTKNLQQLKKIHFCWILLFLRRPTAWVNIYPMFVVSPTIKDNGLYIHAQSMSYGLEFIK